MTSRKIYVNIFGSRATISASKKRVESSKNAVNPSENVEPHDKVLTFEELKNMNAKELSYAKEKDKTNYSWYVKEKHVGKPKSI